MRYFIDMAATVSRADPRARFLIVGDGPLRPALEAQAAALRIADRVIFTGQRDDVPRLLSALTVFVSPSLYEACQYNLLEAMASGLSVVSTPVGVAPEAIRPGETGLLARTHDGEDLAARVLQLLHEPEKAKAMGMRARQLATDRFSLEAMVDGLVEIYRSLL
jgi:glycosyltransferase involved in cell wall biosynthesis